MHSLNPGGIYTFATSMLKLNIQLTSKHDLLLFSKCRSIELPCKVFCLEEIENNLFFRYNKIRSIISEYDCIFVHYTNPILII
jgi:hypothetical protein